MDIILASKSKRRVEMMNELQLPYRIVTQDSLEFVDSFSSNSDLVMQLAKQKAAVVFENNKDSLVLGFDTLVFLDNEILGKPQSVDECREMIKKLSGRKHEVITGACFMSKDFNKSFSRNCFVEFEKISDEEIETYIHTDEPYDKAGGYAVQGYMGRFIKKVEGDFFSVIGMPKSEVYKLLKEYIRLKNE